MSFFQCWFSLVWNPPLKSCYWSFWGRIPNSCGKTANYWFSYFLPFIVVNLLCWMGVHVFFPSIDSPIDTIPSCRFPELHFPRLWVPRPGLNTTLSWPLIILLFAGVLAVYLRQYLMQFYKLAVIRLTHSRLWWIIQWKCRMLKRFSLQELIIGSMEWLSTSLPKISP